jgi:hypothetical protein
MYPTKVPTTDFDEKLANAPKEDSVMDAKL